MLRPDSLQVTTDRLAALIEVARACALVDAEYGTLYLVDAEHKQLRSAVLQSDRLTEIRLPIGNGISGHVANTGFTINRRHRG
ncbi:MAG: hypothetical protein ACR2PL_02390 [Dehalococcoidia bacterium]